MVRNIGLQMTCSASYEYKGWHRTVVGASAGASSLAHDSKWKPKSKTSFKQSATYGLVAVELLKKLEGGLFC